MLESGDVETWAQRAEHAESRVEGLVTMTYSLDAAPTVSPPAAAPPVPTGPPPTIVASRRRLDNRFPVLGFTIRTQGRPYFEVLLATDRALFDPASAAKRNPSNFYAGRQDGGLAAAGTEETAYIVPAAVLRRFADARPRPAEIFFTVAAYDTPDGPPLLAQPPQVLASTAPSVLLGGDFQAQTLAVVLGVPAEKLRPADEVREDAVAAAASPAPGGLDDGYPAGEAMTWSVDEDEAEAQAAAAWLDDPQALALDADEPAAAYPPGPTAQGEAFPPGPSAQAHAFPPGPTVHEAPWDPGARAYADEGADVEGLGYDDGYGAAYDAAPPTGEDVAEGYEDDPVEAYEDDVAAAYDDGVPAPPDEPAGAAQSYAEEDGAFAYEDGYDDEPASAQAAWAQAEESVFPEGAAEPATLADEGDERYEAEIAAAEAYDAPYDEPHDEPYEAGMAAYEAHAGGNGAAPAPPPPPQAPAPPAARPLDIPAKIAIVTKLGRLFESPDGFSAAALDPRTGLRAGFAGFHGRLLQHLLRFMRERDAATFRTLLGTDADTLPATEDSVRRLRSAGAHPPFQAAQNELAVRAFLDPMLVFAAGLGLDTERGLAMLADRAMQMGRRAALRWVGDAAGPIRTDAQRQQALGALGFPGVPEFQRAAGVRRDGDFGPLTQAAMVGALRRLGAASPIPIPTREQLMDAIVARADAQGAPWRQRPRTIRTSPEFADVPLTWATAAAGRR